MSTINKPLLRIAAALHATLGAAERNEPLIEVPEQGWRQCCDLVRKARRARLRGWHLAANVLSGDLSYAIPAVQHELTALQNRLRSHSARGHVASTIDVYKDLVALSDEFEDFVWDRQRHTLSVTSEPIVLQGVYLGPFEVHARLAAGEPSYRVIAKDPHPPESRQNVTHPHVMDDVLCEGDGRHAIRQSLAQGRLLDFFTLVMSVLRTYNAESPFVELALWRGLNCSDCGSCVDEDDAYACSRCGSTVCAECELLCRGCEESCCSSCIAGCATCDEVYCGRCLGTCKACRQRICTACLDESERCKNCHEERIENEKRDSAPEDGTAIQPCGLGQAPFSA